MRKPTTGAGLPKDVYPVLRVSSGYYLRGFDLLSRLQDDTVQALVFATVLHGQMAVPGAPSPSVRGLSRALGVPYETVRRHAVELVRRGQCAERDGGLIVPAKVQNGRGAATFLLGIHANTVQFLIALTGIKVAHYRGRRPRPLPGAKLAGQQRVIALAGTANLLAALKTARSFWEGDVVTGIVFTAIWTANVKHVAPAVATSRRGVLEDELRQPVSALAVSKALGMPYETVRRHIQALIDEDVVVRVGRNGLIAPARAHRRRAKGSLLNYQLVLDFLADLRRAGVKA